MWVLIYWAILGQAIHPGRTTCASESGFHHANTNRRARGKTCAVCATYIYTLVYIYIHITSRYCAYVYVQTCELYMYMYTCMHVYMCIHADACVYIYIYLCYRPTLCNYQICPWMPCLPSYLVTCCSAASGMYLGRMRLDTSCTHM